VLGAVRVTARYIAPSEDGGFLAEPPLPEIGNLLAANASLLDSSATEIGGVPLAEFRRQAVAEVTETARRYLAESGEPAPPAGSRLLVAGHQPELFHPGVWVKNFALHGLAARHGRAPLNLVVDNDTVKSTTVHVPVVSERVEEVTTAAVPFDRPAGDVPYEDYRVADRGQFASFPERLSEYFRAWGYRPLANDYWSCAVGEVEGGATVGEAFSRTRRCLERRWGLTNLELPTSRLACTGAFAGFAQTLLADAPRFADAYNAAIRDYRTRNHLRSRNHPAPELGHRNDLIEAPYWVWRLDSPHREKLFVRRVNGHLELFAGNRPLERLSIEPGEFVRGWAGLLHAGWRIRPRALTLTLFVRLCLADAFIHGIGGGKYDQVTDGIIRRYFHIAPPAYAVVSATLRLPLKRFPATAADLHRAERHMRDVEWNPQRFPGALAGRPELVADRVETARTDPADRAARKERFRRLQRLTRELRPAVAGEREAATRRLERVRAELAANAVLTSREYAWPLFPEATLRAYFTRLLR
jgi:hypothetical protein